MLQGRTDNALSATILSFLQNKGLARLYAPTLFCCCPKPVLNKYTGYSIASCLANWKKTANAIIYRGTRARATFPQLRFSA